MPERCDRSSQQERRIFDGVECLETDEGQEADDKPQADRISHITIEHPPDDGKGMLLQD